MNFNEDLWKQFHVDKNPDIILKPPPELTNLEIQPSPDKEYGITSYKLYDVHLNHLGTPWRCLSRGKPNSDYVYFCNSELSIENSAGSNTLVINVGESWCYGGSIRDMDLKYTESVESLHKAFYTTMGAKMAKLSQSDLHQFTYPGNCNTAMFRWLSERLYDIVSNPKYNKILLVIQQTDHLREFTDHGQGILPSTPELQNLLSHQSDYSDKKLFDNHTEFNHTYWHLLWSWLEDILADVRERTSKTIDVIMWSNFFDLPPEVNDHDWQNIPESWMKFTSRLEGGDCPNTIFGTPDFLNILKHYVKNIDIEFVESEVKAREKVQQWWERSHFRLNLMPYYPTDVSHALWAGQIINQAGWLTYPQYA